MTGISARMRRRPARAELGAAVSALAARSWAPAAALGFIYVTSVVVYTVLSRQHLIPDLLPDEIRYAKLSQALADGSGLDWRGSNQGLPPLWTALLSVVWHFGSVPHGYVLGRELAALLVSTTVVPTWLLARVFVGPRLALIPAALAVMGAWMIVSGFIISENVAYPLATASLACTTMALRDTRSRWVWGAVAFALLATAARTQMLSLFVILAVALLVDVARQPSRQRMERFGDRPPYLWIGIVASVVALVTWFIVKPGLTNYEVLAHHASIGRIAATTGHHLAAAVLMLGIVPVALVAAMMARAGNWRDDTSGPVLATVLAASVVTFPLVGRFEAWATNGSPVDRYAMYLAPLFMLALLLAPGRIGRRGAVAAAIATAAAMLGLPRVENLVEQPAVYGMEHRFTAAGIFTSHPEICVVLLALAIGLAAALTLTGRAKAGVGMAIAVLGTAALLVTQNWTDQAREVFAQQTYGPSYLAKPYDWVDRAATGPVGLIAIGPGEVIAGNPDVDMDFFNRQVKYAYATDPIPGLECQLGFARDGRLQQRGGACHAWPRNFVMLERDVHATLHDERQLGRRPNGRLVTISSPAPRLLAVVQPACNLGGVCGAGVRLGFYLDEPGSAVLTFAGGRDPHRVQVGSRVQAIRPSARTRIRIPLKAGADGVNLPVDWTTVRGAPRLQSVFLRSGGKTTRVY